MCCAPPTLVSVRVFSSLYSTRTATRRSRGSATNRTSNSDRIWMLSRGNDLVHVEGSPTGRSKNADCMLLQSFATLVLIIFTIDTFRRITSNEFLRCLYVRVDWTFSVRSGCTRIRCAVRYCRIVFEYTITGIRATRKVVSVAPMRFPFDPTSVIVARWYASHQ